ncbi:Rho GTPase-activating protein 21 [Liparis tanakae]|uniref:Rho GTPase-activating protein 21 n=1 Tax=Liparis tanakae TaxID=230148 RepID=A0A4Z2G2M9_9TELE|nr:Rho GTPase-activating protein 21 [Liparis tanakae]
MDDNTSDLGTMSSGASAPRSRPKKWSGAAAEVSSITSVTSDYSTTSSLTFLAGALSPEPHGGEEADDERSELVSEGRPAETDSESDFPVFAPGAAGGQSTPRPADRDEAAPPRGGGAAEGGGGGVKPEARRLLFPSQRMIEGDTLSRRWSLRQKTDSESSAEGGAGSAERGEAAGAESTTRLSRVLEVMKRGRSTSSLSSSSRSESERAEPPGAAAAAAAAWHLKITERLKFKSRSSADDMFAQKSGGGGGRKKNIRRRHTLGGQRDFAELAVVADWRRRGGGGAVDPAAEPSALDRLKPRCSSQDFSIRDWISRERRRGSDGGAEAAPRAVPEEDRPAAPGAPPPPPPPAPAGEKVNGGGPQGKNNKAGVGAEPHPHKLSVVRSRFYQYL